MYGVTSCLRTIWLLRWWWNWWWWEYNLGNFSDQILLTIPPSSAFAWQAGGGLIYELSDQVTFDVSYRWYQLGNFILIGTRANENWQFSASQVMFSLRMFEPLRSLLR